MSNDKNQHFIPRFLQRGFLSRIEKPNNRNKKKEFTYMYDKNRGLNEENIKSVGSETYFYKSEKDLNNTLNNTITDLENSFYTKIINNVRNKQIVDNISLARLIAHFEIRNRNIRNVVCNSIEYIFENYLKNNELKQIFDRLHLPYSMTDILMKFIKENYSNKLAQLCHNQVIKYEIDTNHRAEDYSKLNYKIVYTKVSIPLGDSIILFHLQNEKFASFSSDEDFKAILLPVSSNMLIVGSYENYIEDIMLIVENICKCSNEFFISKDKIKSYEDKIKLIGMNQKNLVNDDELADYSLNDINPIYTDNINLYKDFNKNIVNDIPIDILNEINFLLKQNK